MNINKKVIDLKGKGLIYFLIDAKSKQLIEKQRIKRRILTDNWKQKFEKTRENALIVTVEDTTEACNSYAEKMIKIQKDKVRN